MSPRTKIICTIGPQVASKEKLVELLDAGMNVARLNFSHGTHAEHKETIARLKEIRRERGIPLAIMLDNKGPEVRLGPVAQGAMQVEPGQRILLTLELVEGNRERVSVVPNHAVEAMKVGAAVLFNDGYILSRVVEKNRSGAVVEIQNSGVLKNQSKVNIPGVDVDLPALTSEDICDLQFGCAEDVDIIAASFIRSAQHVREIKSLLAERGKPEILVVAKIENGLGVQNFDQILQAADGIMVARGDLGVELPLKEVPRLQKMMIRKCYQACKPVVTATQMLESMIQNPRPTRAEVSDVANAIYDSTSAVMLSGETATGKYPIQAVEMMRSIIEESEADFDFRDFFYRDARSEYTDISSSVALASVKTAYSTGAKAIFAFTSKGFTARLIARFRPAMPIFALTADPKIYHQLAFAWGVIPVPPAACANIDEGFDCIGAFAHRLGLLQPNDLVVVTAGVPFGVSGTTNTMVVKRVS